MFYSGCLLVLPGRTSMLEFRHEAAKGAILPAPRQYSKYDVGYDD
jgi:hypothetical protein